MTDNILDTLTEQQQLELEKQALAVLAQEDTVDGFICFYELMHGLIMPKHVKKWAETAYEAKAKGLGLALQAFRGSTKTTFVQTFLAFQMGKHPDKASMVIQVSDDKADKFTKQVASFVEHSTGWKIVYPHIVPDKERGWSSTGYELKDDSIPYNEWRDKNSKRTTPSLVGCGWSSGMIVGFHPDLVLILDDILDRNNTDSNKSMEAVRETIKASINPAAEMSCFRILAYTPWKENDPVIEQSLSGNYILVKTPIFTVDFDSQNEWNGYKYVPAWKKKGTPDLFTYLLNESGRIEFARMYLLDLTQASNRTLKYHYYPNDKIKSDWAMGGGVDYASARSNLQGNTKTDYFAMAYLAKIPGGGVVVYDGVLERGTQATAEAHVGKAQAMFPNWINSVVESDGKGEDFIQLCMRNPSLRIVPKKTGGVSKSNRILQVLSPWLESGQIRISDADTPFLVELRKELDEFPDCEHDDALDAVYYGAFAVQDALRAVNVETINPVKRIMSNPYAAFGRR
jgi:hypothetical protein